MELLSTPLNSSVTSHSPGRRRGPCTDHHPPRLPAQLPPDHSWWRGTHLPRAVLTTLAPKGYPSLHPIDPACSSCHILSPSPEHLLPILPTGMELSPGATLHFGQTMSTEKARNVAFSGCHSPPGTLQIPAEVPDEHSLQPQIHSSDPRA